MKLGFAIVLALSLYAGRLHSQTSYVGFRGNPALTGVYNTKPLYGLTEIKFNFATGGPIRSTPAVLDNKLFFGSGDGIFYAVDAESGKEIWRFVTSGAVHSSPAIHKRRIYFSSRDGYLYCLSVDNGKLLWRFKMGSDAPYANGWDYYLSSPNTDGNTLYLGSGDRHLYAFDLTTHKLRWKFNTQSRIRATPAVSEHLVLAGAMNGNLYALDKRTGTLRWTLSTRGTEIPFDKYGYDATGILCAPSVAENIVVLGARDGYLYALDLKSGTELWERDHNTGWVLGTGIYKTTVIAGGGFGGIEALDLKTGTEKWTKAVGTGVFSSITINEGVLYFVDYRGNVFAVESESGNQLWHFCMGRRSLSSALAWDGVFYCSSDNGVLYAIKGNTQPSPVAGKKKPRKILCWQAPKSKDAYRWFRNNVDQHIKDYFTGYYGYELMNGEQLAGFMRTVLADASATVVVFADNEIPATVVEERSEKALIRRYLNAGGKAVFLGPNPLAYYNNPTTGENDSVNFALGPLQVFGLHYDEFGTINDNSVYGSTVTKEGQKIGLNHFWVGYGFLPLSEVTTVLGITEYGKASAWLKNYGGPFGTGILQLSLPKDVCTDLAPVIMAAEKGIDW